MAFANFSVWRSRINICKCFRLAVTYWRLRIFSFGGNGLAFAALTLVVFGAYDSYPRVTQFNIHQNRVSSEQRKRYLTSTRLYFCSCFSFFLRKLDASCAWQLLFDLMLDTVASNLDSLLRRDDYCQEGFSLLWQAGGAPSGAMPHQLNNPRRAKILSRPTHPHLRASSSTPTPAALSRAAAGTL